MSTALVAGQSLAEVGLVRATFERWNGTTRLAELATRPPLHALLTSARTVSPDSVIDPSLAQLTLVSTGPGLLPGDEWQVSLRAESGANVRITTQAAMRVHGRENGGEALLTLDLLAGADARVEYLPEPTILFRDARFRQETTLDVDHSARLVFRDVLMPGRLARGEAFAFATLRARLTVRVAGEVACRDALALDGPLGESAQTVGRFGRRPVIGTLLVIAPDSDARALADAAARSVPPPNSQLLAGATALPGGVGLLLRALGTSTQIVERVLDRALRACS